MGTVSSSEDSTSHRTKLPWPLDGKGPIMTRGGFEGFSQCLYIVQAWLLSGHQWGMQEGWRANLSPQPT